MDDFQRVLSVAGHGNAGDDFAFAVQVCHATPLVGAELDVRNVADQHRKATLGLDDQVGDVVLAPQVALTAHHVLALCHFDDTPADVPVGIPDDVGDVHQADSVGAQLHRIDHHLVLLYEAADRSDFGHALRLGQLVADVPILQGAQFGQRSVGADHCVLIDPAHARGVRPDLRHDPGRQAAGGKVQVLDDARARPVDIGPVLEDDVNE